MLVDLCLVHTPEAAMSAHQCHEVRRLHAPERCKRGDTLTVAEYVATTTLKEWEAGLELRHEGGNGWLVVDRVEGTVYFCSGYHGRNVYEALRDGRGKEVWLRLMD